MRAALLAVTGVIAAVLSAGPAGAGDVPSPASSSPADFTAVGTHLFFTADDGIHGRELWVTDGTSAGTHQVRDVVLGAGSSEPHELTAVGDTLFFAATGAVRGTELWRSDGTEEGTSLVRDIVRGGESSSPDGLAEANGLLYFAADHPLYGREPWHSDGTREGTALLRDLVRGPMQSYVRDFTPFQGSTYFGAMRHGLGRVWRTDGTAQGTVRVFLAGEYSGFGSPGGFLEVGGRLFFLHDDDGDDGADLFVTDGTADGTIGLDHDNSWMLTDLGGILYFAYSADGSDSLLRLDPATLDITFVVQPNPGREQNIMPRVLGNLMLFGAGDGQGGVTGVELWRSDGTPEGSYVVKDINGPYGSHPTYLTPLDGAMLFRADGGHMKGFELWRTDGTADGTSLVKDINPTGSSSPTQLTRFGDLVVFAAYVGESGVEPWITDGTEAGTVLLANIA